MTTILSLLFLKINVRSFSQSLTDVACEQALCLGKKNSKEREGKGGESL